MLTVYVHLFQESSPSKLTAPSPASSQGVQQLKQQLATLTSSMATLMEEKSKMESNFQADKKAILVCSDTVLLRIVTRGGGHSQ
jgi:hypothetical protein